MSLAQKLIQACLVACPLGDLESGSLSSLPDLVLQPSTAHDDMIKSMQKQKYSNNRGASRRKYQKLSNNNKYPRVSAPSRSTRPVYLSPTVMAAGSS